MKIVNNFYVKKCAKRRNPVVFTPVIPLAVHQQRMILMVITCVSKSNFI